MGFMKRQLEEELERGWRTTGKTTCPSHFLDSHVRQIAVAAADAEACDFCGANGHAVACDLDVILGTFGDVLRAYWTPAVGELFHDSGEGGFIGTTFDTYDLLRDELEMWDIVDDDRIADAIIDALQQEVWCDRHHSDFDPQESLALGWETFERTVKHESRYVFLIDEIPSDHRDADEGVHPSQMMQRLGQLIVDENLVRDVPAGSVWYRGRSHRAWRWYSTAKDLGSPPPDDATSNRMSPTGISMFYGCAAAETVAPEVRPGRIDIATIGRWETARPMKLLDLSSLPPIPSIFDVAQQQRRYNLVFLHSFAADLAKPIEREAGSRTKEHIEYVPTQIVTEYVRRVLRVDGQHLHGIVYRSSRRAGHDCVVLFVDNEGCVEALPGWTADSKAVLALVPGSAARLGSRWARLLGMAGRIARGKPAVESCQLHRVH